MSRLLFDLVQASRALAKRPFYAALTVVVFAIAIGANATVFSVLNGFLLRPLPYPDGDRLVMVYDSYPKLGLDDAGTAIPDYLERREQAHSLESLAIVSDVSRTLGSDGPPERVLLSRASPSLFGVLRVSPLLGRTFTEDEATLGNDRVIVLSYRLWMTRFGAQPDLVGRDIRLDGEAYRVIGVMPEGFGFPSLSYGAWIPYAFTPEQTADTARGNQFSTSIGRLRDGATLEGLNSELAAIVKRNVEEGRIGQDAIDFAGFTGRAQFLRATRVGDLTQMLLLLQALVGAVLLIACANIANLQLARAAARRKELAVRAALGAGARALVRLVMAESVVLAAVGGMGGLVLANLGLALVRALGLDRANQGFAFELDARVLTFTFGAALIAALVSGLPSVLALLRDDLTRAVREAGRHGGGGRRANALRGALVVAQVGMSVALLVGAGLLVESFVTLEKQGPGFEVSNVWTGRLTLPTNRYPNGASWARLESQAIERLRALPGVLGAGFTSVLPFVGNNNQGSVAIDGYTPPPGAPAPHAQHRSIDAGYFATLGIPVVEGRNFAENETERVVIVDENVATRYWPEGNVLGQRVRVFGDSSDEWWTIVGVVPAVKQASLAETPDKETMYWHYRQRPMAAGVFTLRTALPPEQMTQAARAVVMELDPDLALYDTVPLGTRVLRSMGPQRAPMVLTLVFAAVAFTLAVIGVYGVIAWSVTQRVGDIGVRVALGARSVDVLRMVMTQGGKMIVIGLAFGVVGALAIGRVLAAEMTAVRAIDPLVLAVAVGGLALAALAATWVPARRAARIDPMQALRTE